MLKDAIFDDVLALKQPSAMWPRPVAVGTPNARGNVLRQQRLRYACLSIASAAQSAKTSVSYTSHVLLYLFTDSQGAARFSLRKDIGAGNAMRSSELSGNMHVRMMHRSPRTLVVLGDLWSELGLLFAGRDC